MLRTSMFCIFSCTLVVRCTLNVSLLVLALAASIRLLVCPSCLTLGGGGDVVVLLLQDLDLDGPGVALGLELELGGGKSLALLVLYLVLGVLGLGGFSVMRWKMLGLSFLVKFSSSLNLLRCILLGVSGWVWPCVGWV